jgi:hypothetical protein
MILGWDIGGVHTKAAAVEGAACRTASIPFEIQRDPRGLSSVLRDLIQILGAADTHAVTMTAELSRAFRTKREGVGFVLDALAAAAPGVEIHVYTTEGRFVTPEVARAAPLAAAASNWLATASLVARTVSDCLLIDIGSTSTDIIPILNGQVAAAGRTDPERLLSGELVYTGALRTPAEALVSRVPLWNGAARTAAEGFAVTGDAHLWLGRLQPADWSTATPDGRPAERAFAGDRLARLVCGDREMLDDAAVDGIAHAIADAQVRAVADGIAQVRGRADVRHAARRAIVTGLGDFIAADAARLAGLEVCHLSERLGAAARVAPAVAVAMLLADAG